MNRLTLLLLSLGSLCWTLPGTAQTAPSKWVSYDAATKTVTFALEAGAPGTAGPFNFNGYTNGAATLTVPPGSTVVMNFVNLDGTPHSAERQFPDLLRRPRAWTVRHVDPFQSASRG